MFVLFLNFVIKNKTKKTSIKVAVEDSDVVVQTFALQDSGFSKSFGEKCLVEQFDLDGSQIKLAVQTMMLGTPHVMNTKMVSFNLSSLDCAYSINLS